MPPRKAKAPAKTQQIDESPVVFFLKVTENEQDSIIPAGDVISYSDILNTVERNTERFNTDLLKDVLSKVRVEQYSQHTACFWCCHTFSWVSCILPISYDVYNNIYSCEGNFCSPECALAHLYADNKIPDAAKWNRHALLNHLYADLYKTRALSPAPPRSLLRLFGGQLDIEQYRDYITGDNYIVLAEVHPIRLIFPSMNVQGPLRDIKKYVSLSSDVVEKASEQLRLKRSKPMNVNVPTLDMCMKRA
jgi:hypothetical protein|uniref:MYM-type domain-containing protein n=1 Tax=viral metagenome TaxID=1070528 RepID=A0A6C0DQB1_9ZZZZ